MGSDEIEVGGLVTIAGVLANLDVRGTIMALIEVEVEVGGASEEAGVTVEVGVAEVGMAVGRVSMEVGVAVGGAPVGVVMSAVGREAINWGEAEFASLSNFRGVPPDF